MNEKKVSSVHLLKPLREKAILLSELENKIERRRLEVNAEATVENRELFDNFMGVAYIDYGTAVSLVQELFSAFKQDHKKQLESAITSLQKYLELGEKREHPNITFLRTEKILKDLLEASK